MILAVAVIVGRLVVVGEGEGWIETCIVVAGALQATRTMR
jgi:hypothetical protein